MKRNSKLAILIVFMTVAIFVWVPKGKKAKDVSSTTSTVAFDQAIPVTRAVPSKRTEFVDWGRNPFTFPQGEEEVGSVSHLKLFAIIWNDKEALAFINESVVRVGDKITDKTVKRIEQDRVILTDGTKDYVLKLQE
ncbi:MAG: hypothetical protein ACETVZ_09555 [Phycisphaerae bacterium]